MKNRFLIIAVRVLLITSLLALFSVACAEETDKSGTSEAPLIPPQSTFVMDFSAFTQAQTLSSLGRATGALAVSAADEGEAAPAAVNALGDQSNYNFAAFNVGFWNLVGSFGLAIPVASFTESFKHTAVKQPDGSWAWTYSITVNLVTYTAELHGKYIPTGVRWEMYITRQNEYTDYLWYYGESDLGNTQGFWVLKAEPAKGNDLLRIDWHRNPANETGDIKYTNIVPDGPENGGNIQFIVSAGEPYNRSYTIFNKGKNQTTYIEWNETTKAGRVKDSVYFGDESWRCWDSSLKNIACA